MSFKQARKYSRDMAIAKAKQNREDLAAGVWRSKDGTVTPFNRLKSNHIAAILRMMELLPHWRKGFREALELELARRSGVERVQRAIGQTHPNGIKPVVLKPITYAMLTPLGAFRYLAEASALGLPPGHWPKELPCADEVGSGRPFHFECVDGDARHYTQHVSNIQLTVLND